MHAVRPAALAAALVLAWPATAAETGAETVVATVNGTETTLGHMIAARERLPQEYQQLPPDTLFKGLLDQLIQQEALRTGREELSRRSVLALENERRSLQVTEIISAAIEEAITDEAIQAAYNARYADAAPEKEFNAAHILVATEEEARALIGELEAGADFATLAREKSTGPSGPNGGDLGWFGTGMMVPEFEEAVIALEPGTVSEPVQTQFGWHVIRLNEVRQKDAPTLDEVRAELIQQIQSETIDGILASATEGAEITRLEEGAIDPAILSDSSILEE